MFAKIFTQIFDSSIAEHYQHRHIFMDMLVLADSDGVIDMTMEAIARRTNVPIEQVKAAIDFLSAPDDASRTPGEDGRRLLPLDGGRAWGWQIVNYHHYRRIRDEESRREYFRDYRRNEREDKRGAKIARAPGSKPGQKASGTNGKKNGKIRLDPKGSAIPDSEAKIEGYFRQEPDPTIDRGNGGFVSDVEP